MVAPETTKPTAATVGGVKRSGEQLTSEGYLDVVSDQDWEAAVLPVIHIAGGDSERGERGRRALHCLYDTPFIERSLWTAAMSVAWVFIAAIVAADADLRARANLSIKSVLALAAEAQRELGRAA